tara:strand:- start:276 stop:449 length:174 start_codon:yes stop_codon:yes gene_type:complete
LELQTSKSLVAANIGNINKGSDISGTENVELVPSLSCSYFLKLKFLKLKSFECFKIN